jgi:hypothetical protein
MFFSIETKINLLLTNKKKKSKMKKLTLVVLALGLTCGAFAQKQNATLNESTLKVKHNEIKDNTIITNFDNTCATLDSAKFYQATYQGSFVGYVSGQNLYGDKAYAEKYALTAAKSIKGIGAYIMNATPNTAKAQTNYAKLFSSDFTSELGGTTYQVTTDLNAEGMTQFMFASPVTAQNFAAAVEVGELDLSDTNSYNLLTIATTPVGCATGENSYSYSATDTLGNYGWITMNAGWSADFDMFIFPIVDGSVGLNSVDLNNLTYVYPNPAKEEVMLASSVNMNRVEISNMLGQVVYSNNVNGISVKVNTSEFANGNYVVKMYTESGTVTKKLTIK